MNWTRIYVSGIVWAAVYDLVWGVAWFAFMRAEWQEAFDSLGQPMLWTPGLWAVWIVVTCVLGIALAGHAADKPSPLKVWLRGSLVMWLFVAGGSDAAFVMMSFPTPTIVLDTLVNLVGMFAAAFAAAYACRRLTAPPA